MFEIFRANGGGFFWHLKATNGESCVTLRFTRPSRQHKLVSRPSNAWHRLRRSTTGPDAEIPQGHYQVALFSSADKLKRCVDPWRSF